MQRLKKTIEINAPVQRVYDYLTQPANLPAIWPSMLSVTNIVSRGNGAHDFDWVYKMGGIHFHGHSRTEEARPGKFVRVRSDGGIQAMHAWSYEGTDRTRLTCEVEYTVPTPVIGKIAEALVVKMNAREMDALMANLKEVMESSSTIAATHAPAH